MSESLDQIKLLINALPPKKYAKGETIIQAGNENTSIFILLSGQAGIFSKNELIATMNTPFDLLGEMSYITKKKSNNDVIAMTDVSIAHLTHEFIQTHFIIILPFITLQLVNKLQNTNKKAYLYELANKELKKTQKILESASFKKIEESVKDYNNILHVLNQIVDTDILTIEKKQPILKNEFTPIKNKIKTITERISAETYLSQQKILVLDDQTQNHIHTKMALGGTGAKLFFAKDLEAALQHSENEKFDFIFLNDTFIDSIPQLEVKQKKTHFVLITSQAINEFYDKIKNNPKIETIISKHPEDQTFTIKNIITTVQKLSQQNLFGFEKYLHWGTHINEKWITSSDERSTLIEEMEAQLQELGVRGALLRKVGKVAEELLMNAIYDAPCDKNRTPLYNHLQRTVKVELKTEEYAQFRYACDGSLIAISVQDPFGSLKRETVFDYLNRNFDPAASPDIQDKNKGGGGRGLFEAIHSSSLIVFNIDPHKKTEVIALFNIAMQTQKISLHPSFHYFEKKPHLKKTNKKAA